MSKLTNKDVKFNYYSGNIFETKALGTVTLEKFINVNKNPTPATIKLLAKISKATECKDLKLKRELKHQLYSFTPSVLLIRNGFRSYSYISEWTGLMQIDLDGIETYEKAIEIKQHIFNSYKEIVVALISPSGKGVKCLMKTITPTDKEHYRALHKSMVNTFEQYGYLDISTKNAMLPLFLSADINILYRDYSECDAWAEEDWTTVSYVELNDDKPNNFNVNNIDGDYNTKKVIRITETRINNISDNGHPQVRATALILGSRIGAGYIQENDARCLLRNLIEVNSYLKKDLSNYIRTAHWGITEGMKNPKYFK